MATSILTIGKSIITKVRANEFKSKLVSDDIVVALANVFESSIFNGFEKNIADVEHSSNEYFALQTLQANAYDFATFKTAKFIQELNLLSSISSSDKEFLTAAKKLNKNYNQNYLKTEAHWYSRVAAQSRRWQDIQKSKETYPLLTYHTREDERVRLKHQGYNLITLPVNHPFWLTHYPPIAMDLGCRCFVTQHAYGDITLLPDKILNELLPQSPAITNIPFAASHPYFKAPASNKAKLYDISKKLLSAA